ncbi:PAS-domain containing protein [Lutimaribacter sp. EGI FJ00015]|uniref:PAS-domain containing protein n=1 Tax=Lutimaribacter degradans TaxID=2945989 RepID=A0ACC5ZVA1_9RHOB|nr:PAS-domain containing protein [Lutimaribacter sp. EGI FJ00013]MCM2562002.1 PAS-domain containing protein [Lutimaribacter sp. EGI FJ00013]MCO0612966.1 PAS-domain containing protein [Lutimaribacter sp. EGI FJ00015]MCO0635834.1 PAS-domain containing protein [Lutimaribacter sp. EGI FJ00014]
MFSSGIDLLLLAAAALGGAGGVALLWWLTRASMTTAAGNAAPQATAVPAAFLFSGRDMVDMANTSAFFEDRLSKTDLDDWAALVQQLSLRFSDVPDDPNDLAEGETVFRPGDTADPGKLVIRHNQDCTRLLMMGNPLDGMSGSTLHKLQGALAELGHMRLGLAHTPNPIFAQDKDSRMLWANPAYLALAKSLGFDSTGEGARPPQLFDDLTPCDQGFANRRVSVAEPGGDVQHWYDLSTVDAGSRKITYCMNVDAIVKAEIAQRNFVQTLTKTFAHLSIGLAIFNRDRQLALFNPALVDLTELPVDFLSGRPTILCFFDMLRDKQMMPEPKNYANWRERIGTLVAAASDGHFHETWSLPSGQTYRVTGRPHPDGAVAFLFEDISHEVSLTRSFRSELALGNAVLDQMDAAMAVFTADGVLAFSNSEFRAVWGVDPDSAFADTSIGDALTVWRGKSDPATHWRGVEEALTTGTALDGITVRLNDGSRRICRVRPLINGARMVAFARDSRVAVVETG